MNALEFKTAGVEFLHRNGLPFVKCPKALRDDLETEVERRAAAMRGRIPASGPVPVLEVSPRPASVPRAGLCSCCFDRQQAWMGGMCPLCVAATRRVLKELGRI